MKWDWQAVQLSYNNNGSYSTLVKEFGLNKAAIAKAVKEGLLVTRSNADATRLWKSNNPQTHTEETKEKISRIRRKYLQENPDKVPYLLNHSSKRSWPEIKLEKAMTLEGITGFKYNYQMGIYQYDFAFPHIKLDVEVDGSTHLSEKVMAIDKRRDEYSKSIGWKVLRISAKDIKHDLPGCIMLLKSVITDLEKEAV